MAKRTSKKKEVLAEEVVTPSAPQVEEAVAPPTFLTGPTVVGGQKFFTKKDLEMLELYQLRVVSVDREIKLRQGELEKFVNEAQNKIKATQAEIDKTKQNHMAKVNELRKLYAEIERVYQVSMGKVSYDEVTGEIFTHETQ